MAPSMSLGERPASTMARRAASAATIRSEWSCWGPATTPRPTIAYCPEDTCLGTLSSLETFVAFVSLRAKAPRHGAAILLAEQPFYAVRAFLASAAGAIKRTPQPAPPGHMS